MKKEHEISAHQYHVQTQNHGGDTVDKYDGCRIVNLLPRLNLFGTKHHARRGLRFTDSNKKKAQPQGVVISHK